MPWDWLELSDRVHGGEVALKRVYHIPNGAMLVRENSEKYLPMTCTLDGAGSIRLLGLAVGFMQWEH